MSLQITYGVAYKWHIQSFNGFRRFYDLVASGAKEPIEV